MYLTVLSQKVFQITIPEKKAIPIRKILLISADSSFALIRLKSINKVVRHPNT